MSTVDSALMKIGFGVARPQAQPWKVAPVKRLAKEQPKRSWLGMFQRREPTAYQRCLAVHIHFARPRGGLS
jgi:hypothetical protein